jgi:lysozyme family protein
MASDNFAKCMTAVLKYEGGYVDHPSDPGGATNLGITIGTLRAWRGKPTSKLDVKLLTKIEAMAIYRNKYWDAVKGDALPAGIDLAVFDWAVNSGPMPAVKALQRVLGVPADGYIGKVTLEKIDKTDTKLIINALCQARGSFFQRLKTFKVFGKGWMRRVNEVRATALGMVGG